MWDEIVACEEAGKSWPEWARKALVVYAKKRYAHIQFAGQRLILNDYATFEHVSMYLKRTYTTKGGKIKPFTLRRACIQLLVNEFVASKKTWTAEEKEDITLRYMKSQGLKREAAIEAYVVDRITRENIQAVRRAYERACERNEKGFYTSHLFLQMRSQSSKKSS
jgi:hypothetical protein